MQQMVTGHISVNLAVTFCSTQISQTIISLHHTEMGWINRITTNRGKLFMVY